MLPHRHTSSIHFGMPPTLTPQNTNQPSQNRLRDSQNKPKKNLDAPCGHDDGQFEQKGREYSKNNKQRFPLTPVKPYNAPFVSVYGRETRLEHIMKIKAKPASKSSLGDVPYFLNLKERSEMVVKKQEKSRFDQIMAIKVSKPNISSTLGNYQPKVLPRDNPELREKDHLTAENSFVQCQRNYEKQAELDQKQYRQWKMEQRQRQLQLRKRVAEEEKEYMKQRRKQTQFESMVSKQIRKIEKEREVAERKNGGFAIYVYSPY